MGVGSAVNVMGVACLLCICAYTYNVHVISQGEHEGLLVQVLVWTECSPPQCREQYFALLAVFACGSYCPDAIPCWVINKSSSVECIAYRWGSVWAGSLLMRLFFLVLHF